MRILIDSMTMKHKAENILSALALPAGTDKDYIANYQPFCPIGKADRVVFLTDLTKGGMKYQLEQMKNNPGVSEWIVVSPGTDVSTLSEVITILHLSSRVVMCASVEAAVKALKRPAVLKHSCLLISLNPEADEKGVEGILKQLQPGWSIEAAACAPDDDKAGSYSRIVLVGDNEQDFADLSLPEDIEPILVLTGLKDKPTLRFRPEECKACKRSICELAGLQWSEAKMEQQIFLTLPQYEILRMQYEHKSPTALEKGEEFVIWDEFGIPRPEKDYTARNIATFLSWFEACKHLASIQMNSI